MSVGETLASVSPVKQSKLKLFGTALRSPEDDGRAGACHQRGAVRQMPIRFTRQWQAGDLQPNVDGAPLG